MSGLYRNIGAPFTLENGEKVGRGATCRPTDNDLLRRRFKLVPAEEAVLVVMVPPVEEKSKEVEKPVGRPWSPPEARSRRRPKAKPHVELAQELLDEED
jgi:hypothetical protein